MIKSFSVVIAISILLVGLFIFIGSYNSANAEDNKAQLDPENTLYLDLKDGRVVIKMRPDLAPKHVARIKELVRQGFYDGSVFHRVIEGFMAQTGDPTGTGAGGSGKNLDAEFSAEPHARGTVSMARADDSNSADSQFFICFDTATHLNGKYTIWGNVVEGMEYVDNIKKGDKIQNGRVIDPDKIIKIQVMSDAIKEENEEKKDN